jgi:hypothetical protein
MNVMAIYRPLRNPAPAISELSPFTLGLAEHQRGTVTAQ